jgi:hypothetical protein
MFDQTQVLTRFLHAFDIWPADDTLTAHDPDETLQLITYTAHALDDRHRLVLLWLSSHLNIHQHRPV